MKTKKQVIDRIQILEGITLQMYRLLDSLEKSGNIDGQIAPLVEMAMKEYMNYITEEL
jgi:hypothetical protein